MSPRSGPRWLSQAGIHRSSHRQTDCCICAVFLSVTPPELGIAAMDCSEDLWVFGRTANTGTNQRSLEKNALVVHLCVRVRRLTCLRMPRMHKRSFLGEPEVFSCLSVLCRKSDGRHPDGGVSQERLMESPAWEAQEFRGTRGEIRIQEETTDHNFIPGLS